MVLHGWWLSLDYNNHRCPVSSPQPHSTVQPALSTLHICASLAQIIHLVLHPFDQSIRCTEWEQIPPTLFRLCCPGHSTCSQGLSSPIGRTLSGCHCLSKSLLPSFNQPLSNLNGSKWCPHSSLFAGLAVALARSLHRS